MNNNQVIYYNHDDVSLNLIHPFTKSTSNGNKQ